MQVIAIIQARMGSTRFPGKSMHELGGKPSLEHLLDSVSQVLPRESIYVASSTNPEDRPIAEFSSAYGVQLHQGHPSNVASRFFEILKDSTCSHFVRLSGDSPLLDHRAITRAIDLAQESPDAIISSTVARSYPSGTNVELIPRDLFLNAYPAFAIDDDFEHVTHYFYRREKDFSILPLPSEIENPGRYSFSFDTAKDLEKLNAIFQQLEKPHYKYTLAEKCELFLNADSDTNI